MYTFFQPRISVEQEEANIQELIDEEYERREQEERDYWKGREEYEFKQYEEEMHKQMEEDYYNQFKE